MAFADSVRCFPQNEWWYLLAALLSFGGQCCLKRRYSAFWVFSGYFWLSCPHLHRFSGKSFCLDEHISVGL